MDEIFNYLDLDLDSDVQSELTIGQVTDKINPVQISRTLHKDNKKQSKKISAILKIERKKIAKEQQQEKLRLLEEERMKRDKRFEEQVLNPFGFTEANYITGELYGNYFQYRIYNAETSSFNLIPKQILFPRDFIDITIPYFFNYTHWIGIDDDYQKYDPTGQYQRNETGTKQNPQLKIFDKDTPDNVLSVPVNIWHTDDNDRTYYHIDIRPNRIYLADLDDNPIDNQVDTYDFFVDSEHWNNILIQNWNIDKMEIHESICISDNTWILK